MNKQHWQDWLTAIVGVWLIISPWAYQYTLPEGASTVLLTWNFVVSGVAAFVLGAAALASFRMWEEWADVVIGLWLVISPWVLQFTASPGAQWNAVICGAIIIVSAGWTLIEGRQPGHA